MLFFDGKSRETGQNGTVTKNLKYQLNAATAQCTPQTFNQSMNIYPFLHQVHRISF